LLIGKNEFVIPDFIFGMEMPDNGNKWCATRTTRYECALTLVANILLNNRLPSRNILVENLQNK